MSSELYSGILETLPNYFMSILPNNYNLFYYIKDNQYAIYISENQIDLLNLNKAVGSITFAIDNKELIVQYLQSNIKKVGIGHYLMIIIAYIALNKGLNKILLDDDSDLAHKGSIYQKLNCQYINESPEPEM